MEFHEKGDGSLLVEFTVDQSDLKIPDDTEAMIFSSDLFGSKAIKLVHGESDTFASSGDTLIASNQEDITEAVRKELEPLRRKTDQLIGTVDDIHKHENRFRRRCHLRLLHSRAYNER